ncbi:MAG: phosphoenolpyruvate synthase [Candidatus Nitrohelix vancouverensis]|uniref:Phosphoenolpyruvate synthase n=1 Tax=Candidatus Nitrohelix vancouverensis TaxID=2705534 RepID=A0A7T0C0C8_9BACT|nr:MAG: phosphoenolpyruvate synthase [Candidatus Nitrohelix vancouverensis]
MATARVTFGTKAETLDKLAPIVKNALVLPQLRFTTQQWLSDPDYWTRKIKLAFCDTAHFLIIRSSALAEDTYGASNAGHFESIGKVPCNDSEAIGTTIRKVIHSFGSDASPDNQVFVQPYLKNTQISGVAFTRDMETLAPYYIINFDEHPSQTDAVTSGVSNDSKTHIQFKGHPVVDKKFEKLFKLMNELENLFKCDSLDIEFSVSETGELYLFQVRPLARSGQTPKSTEDMESYLTKIHKKLTKLNKPHPYLYGDKTVFGVMPDWNPAEMIGLRPRPLSLSLYKDLITDRTWAYQRDNYGYQNLRSFPLMISLMGLPYIDVRISLNSFIPKSVNAALAEKLCNYYIDRLIQTPSHHDKIEFEIVFSCFNFSCDQKFQSLLSTGFTQDEIDSLKASLLELTNDIFSNETSVFRKDLEKIPRLKERQNRIDDSKLTDLEKIYWFMEDCRRYGTLPFAGLARAAFIATQMLQSLLDVDLLTQREHEEFMSSLHTISFEMYRDRSAISGAEFKNKYGHLRPGTYDILSPRYDEAYELYFNNPPGSANHQDAPLQTFQLIRERYDRISSAMTHAGLSGNAESLFAFCRDAIRGREQAKFDFSRSVSDVLNLVRRIGEKYDISREDMSFINIQTLLNLYATLDHRDLEHILKEDIKRNKYYYEYTCMMRFPALISHPDDIYSFELMAGAPTFITFKRVQATVIKESDLTCENPEGKIVCISSADPGYDWIFTKNIRGLITKFGGTNSHMSIRTAELGIPAVIGAGEKNYQTWSGAQILSIDCANQQVKIIQ